VRAAKKAPYKGRGADSEEKREPASDIDTVPADTVSTQTPLGGFTEKLLD
jgi:hypothetical protein